MQEIKVGLKLDNIVTKDASVSNHPLFTYKGEIVYGVPVETSTQRIADPKAKKKITNSELLAIHENGSPVRNIPPRPLLQPVFEKHRHAIDKQMALVAGRLLEGDEAGANAIMEQLAFRIETWCKQYFTSPDNNWAPNAPSTVKAWARKTSKKLGQEVSPEDKKPLIDTAELRKSIRGMLIEGD